MGETDDKHDVAEILRYERRIVWQEAIDDLDYVRIAFVPHRNRKGPIRSPRNGRLIGYAEHHDAAPGSHHMRRIFWLKPCDRDSDPSGPYTVHYPEEAVDPRTVQHGVIGRRTDRVRGAANRLMT
jgi:hypothetical protein